jgi:hypothetical protein
MNLYSKLVMQFHASSYRNYRQKLYFLEIENVLVRLSRMWWCFDQSRIKLLFTKKIHKI